MFRLRSRHKLGTSELLISRHSCSATGQLNNVAQHQIGSGYVTRWFLLVKKLRLCSAERGLHKNQYQIGIFRLFDFWFGAALNLTEQLIGKSELTALGSCSSRFKLYKPSYSVQQLAGKLVDNKIPWRGDSALKDGSPASLDLSKGMIAKALSSCSASTGDIISTTERLKQELNENFFKALSYVQEIHANCKVFLRTHHQRAGLELMDMIGCVSRRSL
ncbi:hypothetical protein RIF29_25432 [Crotalaria pallida]|uniref:Uncharacterized protein n=1 Tax=Crotalaria pallida TaxID=3830 RepID=A0AAN9ELL2_CROPI